MNLIKLQNAIIVVEEVQAVELIHALLIFILKGDKDNIEVELDTPEEAKAAFLRIMTRLEKH